MSVEHTEYWEEVGRGKFEARFNELFPRGSRQLCPVISVKENSVVIHKDGEIYDDFKIDFTEGYPRFYLHNYCFWV